jgi:SagB-type dehydrogenase family enzyme
VDTDHEVAFSMVSIGRTDDEPHDRPREIPKLSLPTVPLSQSEVVYPELREIHVASSLESAEEVLEWRERAKGTWRQPPRPVGAASMSSSDTIEQVILRRGSTRKFERTPITFEQLSTILRASTQGVWPGLPLLNDLYVIINSVAGMIPGAYFYRCDNGDLECLKQGDFRNEARHLGLQQDLPGDAAAAVFFLADLDSILKRMGNRGYRAVQLEAGILGGKMYLAAYAHHLGATGLTFFDDDVTDFFSPHAQGKSVIFLVAIGKAQRLR